MRRWIGRATMTFALVLPRAAAAQGTPAPAPAPAPAAPNPLAQSLFDQGRQLMDAGAFDKACPLLAESHRLDPAGGTLLNLAVCWEGAGKLATAYVTYNEALSLALRDGRDDRKQIAENGIAGLVPRLSKLTIDVPPDVRRDDLVVRLDGQVVTAAAWGTPAAIDGGSHRIEATAPDHYDFVQTIEVQPERDLRTVAIPALMARPTQYASIGGLGMPQPSPTSSSAPPSCPPGASLREGTCVTPGGYRGLIATSLVLGGVAVVAGIGTGIGAIAMSSDLDESCTDEGQCPPEEESTVSTYDAVTTTSTIAFIAGGALIGLGAVLWITHPAEESPPLTAGIVPVPGGGVVGLSGAF